MEINWTCSFCGKENYGDVVCANERCQKADPERLKIFEELEKQRKSRQKKEQKEYERKFKNQKKTVDKSFFQSVSDWLENKKKQWEKLLEEYKKIGIQNEKVKELEEKLENRKEENRKNKSLLNDLLNKPCGFCRKSISKNDPNTLFNKRDNATFCNNICYRGYYANKCDICNNKCLGTSYYYDWINKTGEICSTCCEKRQKVLDETSKMIDKYQETSLQKISEWFECDSYQEYIDLLNNLTEKPLSEVDDFMSETRSRVANIYEKQREREREQIRKKIKRLEQKTNRTPEEEAELENLRNKLKELEQHTEKQPVNYLPWIIGGSVLVAGIIIAVLILNNQKREK